MYNANPIYKALVFPQSTHTKSLVLLKPLPSARFHICVRPPIKPDSNPSTPRPDACSPNSDQSPPSAPWIAAVPVAPLVEQGRAEGYSSGRHPGAVAVVVDATGLKAVAAGVAVGDAVQSAWTTEGPLVRSASEFPYFAGTAHCRKYVLTHCGLPKAPNAHPSRGARLSERKHVSERRVDPAPHTHLPRPSRSRLMSSRLLLALHRPSLRPRELHRPGSYWSDRDSWTRRRVRLMGRGSGRLV